MFYRKQYSQHKQLNLNCKCAQDQQQIQQINFVNDKIFQNEKISLKQIFSELKISDKQLNTKQKPIIQPENNKIYQPSIMRTNQYYFNIQHPKQRQNLNLTVGEPHKQQNIKIIDMKYSVNPKRIQKRRNQENSILVGSKDNKKYQAYGKNQYIFKKIENKSPIVFGLRKIQQKIIKQSFNFSFQEKTPITQSQKKQTIQKVQKIKSSVRSQDSQKNQKLNCARSAVSQEEETAPQKLLKMFKKQWKISSLNNRVNTVQSYLNESKESIKFSYLSNNQKNNKWEINKLLLNGETHKF